MSLSINNLIVGNVILRINECESTNIYAKNLLSKSEPIEGTVIITDKQTKGKGQFGNIWQTKPYENLTFSIILKPTFLKPTEQFILSKIIAIACVEVLSEYKKIGFKIKWPNDIYYNKKKIAGILIENTISASKINNSIVGVGINVNQEEFYNLHDAISLKHIINNEIELENLLSKILKNFDAYYYTLKTENVKKINEKYQNLLFGLNQKHTFIQLNNQVKFVAKILGTNSLGQLHLQIGEQNLFFNKQEIGLEL